MLVQNQTKQVVAVCHGRSREEKLNTSPGPEDPKKPDKPEDPNRPKDPNERIKIDEKRAEHMFRKSEGHWAEDTPEHRALLEDLVNDKNNYLGPDRHGKGIYAKTLPNGKQLWGELRNEKFINGGINDEPNPYNPITGLCRQEKLSQKIK